MSGGCWSGTCGSPTRCWATCAPSWRRVTWGERGLLALADEHGPHRLGELGAAVLDYAAERARLAIREIPDGVYQLHRLSGRRWD